MAKIVKLNGGTFLQRGWRDDKANNDWQTILNDNRRERRELNAILLQLKVDRLAKSL